MFSGPARRAVPPTGENGYAEKGYTSSQSTVLYMSAPAMSMQYPFLSNCINIILHVSYFPLRPRFVGIYALK